MSRIINTTAENITNLTPALARLTADIRRYELLSVEEEVELFNALAKASGAERDAIKAKIVNANLRFALSVAKKYSNDGDTVCELVSLATIGLMDAVDDFDAEKGFKFISFAVHKIRAAFSEHFRENSTIVRRSNNALIGSKDKKIAERFMQTEHREPTEQELIDALESEYGIKISDKYDVVSVKTASIDARVDSDDDATFGEVGEVAMAIASRNDYEREMEQDDAKYRVHEMLKGLSVREQEVVSRKFGIGFDREQELDEIAEVLGYTNERCRQILMGALKKLQGREKFVRQMIG